MDRRIEVIALAVDLDVEFKELSAEERHKQNLERLAKLRPIDDTFMRELFRNDLELSQVVLRIITGKDDLIVISEETQYDMQHLLNARSICLDVLAVDSEGRRYNLEIQRADNGAAPKRARYHSSAMDIEFLKVGQDFDELPITYVIFITENDTMNCGEPICFIERINTATGKPFGDDEHIIFVNGAYQNAADESDLAKLIHDFKCSKADDMLIKPLAEKTRHYKENAKGVSDVCKVMEDLAKEERQREKYQTAVRMLEDEKLSLTEIAKYTSLPLETVERLAEKYASSSKE